MHMHVRDERSILLIAAFGECGIHQSKLLSTCKSGSWASRVMT